MLAATSPVPPHHPHPHPQTLHHEIRIVNNVNNIRYVDTR